MSACVECVFRDSNGPLRVSAQYWVVRGTDPAELQGVPHFECGDFIVLAIGYWDPSSATDMLASFMARIQGRVECMRLKVNSRCLMAQMI